MFIVIEGIDGAGCETQAKLLTQKLIDSKISSSLIKYPDYERNVGKLIKEFLYQNKELSAEQQFLLYCLQFLMDKERIKKERKDSVVVADRYFTTALCYQTLEGVDIKKALRFADDFGIEKPDFVFYLNVNPEVAIKRKSGENKEKNRREKDFKFIQKTYSRYTELIKERVWTQWVAVNGERSVDLIAQDIYNTVTRKLTNPLNKK